ncbi:hypothetical protein KSK55_03090 [Methanospirillum purgamenti]|jgi:exonuclease III|uniref:Endonuclease/exonuclease/phosphatase domain-containing protein n=1 Tax=Methanospirillum hungatei TaxID=2203 RepID=A0A8F5VM92_METHU|nr:endonuclease/exonuclease/phosphatase family protein [Methanospirillum hungatei]QXO95404.1 hypothetical protein KSK55_03090 [Methanospirillum hungatei]
MDIVGKDMRIVTWNCNGAFRKKEHKLISTLYPDLAIIQECEKPDLKFTSQFPHYLWVGDNNNKGLGIFSLMPIIKSEVHDSKSKYYLPFLLNDILILAFWTKNDTNSPQNRYIGQAFNVLRNYHDHLQSKCMIIGDLNWNVCWDSATQKNPVTGTLTEFNAILANFEIFSAYHFHENIKFGFEKKPTLFLYRKKERPYHVDYIYTSMDFLKNLKMLEIGKFDEWIQFSDHMPVYIDIE